MSIGVDQGTGAGREGRAGSSAMGGAADPAAPAGVDAACSDAQEIPRQRRTQAERSARTASRLLGAALELVSQSGYAATSLAAIGAAAGYSRGVVSHCFGSKAGLLAALIEAMLGHWDQRRLTPSVGKLRGADALCAAIDAVKAQADEQPVVLRAFYTLQFEALGPTPELRPRFAALHARTRRTVQRWIEAGIASGDVDPEVDAVASAALFIGAFRGIMFQWLLDPERVDLDRIFAEQKRSIRRALAPVARAPQPEPCSAGARPSLPPTRARNER
jgi:AcrR family transcriptional regulator